MSSQPKNVYAYHQTIDHTPVSYYVLRAEMSFVYTTALMQLTDIKAPLKLRL